jgi:hypothetical protein
VARNDYVEKGCCCIYTFNYNVCLSLPIPVFLKGESRKRNFRNARYAFKSNQSISFNDYLLEVKQVTEKSSPSRSIVVIIVVIIHAISIMILIDVLVFVVTLDLGYLIYLASI